VKIYFEVFRFLGQFLVFSSQFLVLLGTFLDFPSVESVSLNFVDKLRPEELQEYETAIGIVHG